MARELAFVLINPHTISKSRTGGVIARYVARTDLSLVGARMYNPCAKLVTAYANHVRSAPGGDTRLNNLIADYIEREYSSNPDTGLRRRVMMLLFEGEDAVAKVWAVTGSATLRRDYGQTVRETFGEFIEDENGGVRYFEPAVLVGPSVERAKVSLRLWSAHAGECGGIVTSSSPHAPGEIEHTLVLLKPDNFRYPSLRPGSIIDVLSISGLRICGAKKFRMSVAQAMDFYGPVKESLSTKFAKIGGDRAARALAAEFGFPVAAADVVGLCEALGPRFAAHEFENIVAFMTGHRPADVLEADRATTGSEECLALVYSGVNAVAKIRDILGSTDPSMARPGSVRREFGSNIMVNAAHASDSPENAARELAIVNVAEDTITPWVEKYCR